MYVEEIHGLKAIYFTHKTNNHQDKEIRRNAWLLA